MACGQLWSSALLLAIVTTYAISMQEGQYKYKFQKFCVYMYVCVYMYTHTYE